MTEVRRRFALIVSEFNRDITEQLLAGARDCLREHGVPEEDLLVVRVPGAWELPLVAQKIAGGGNVDAVIAIGCVIRGETSHFDYVCRGAADGLGRVALDAGVPVLFGVLTADTAEQAWARAGGPGGNKGREAARAALDMVRVVAELEGADARA
ncbi:MAG: 6,7-dimethyl-8-ribityllumazine synthase [Longimicrobiales bacterium]